MKVFYLLKQGLLVLLLFAVLKVQAQTGTLSGKVLDETGQPLPGASVAIKGTTKSVGTLTDGTFKFTGLSGGQIVLQISSIGYKPLERTVKISTDVQTIILEADSKILDDVVIVGYGGVKKKDATGAVTLLKPDELSRVKATTATDLLLGKVAGLQITQGSGSPGSSGTVRIRQGASLNASNEPLIVVDGLTEGSLSSLNPNDIESITVLKDASASAIYGARGANGVIIVKTKRGASFANGKFSTPEFNYRADVYINQPFQFLDVYDADEFRTEYTKRGWNTALLGNANTDWQREIARTSATNMHTLSVTGALPYVPYRLSVGYNQEEGTVVKTKREVTTMALTLSPKFFKQHLSIDATVRGTHMYSPQSGGSFSSAGLTDPTQPVYFDYGPVSVNGVNYDQKAYGYFMYGADALGNKPQRASNPVASAFLPGSGYGKSNRYLTNVLMSYKIHGFEDLTLNASFNSSHYKGNDLSSGLDNTPGTWSVSNVNLGKGGIATNSESSSYSNKIIVDYYLNYKKKLDAHLFDVTMGHTYESQRYGSWSGANYYNDGSLVVGSIENSTAGGVAMGSWFARLNYTFNDKYLFTGTIRSDGSSRFAPETRWGFFPSAAFAWKVNEENFLRNFKPLNELKFRVSYGITGQQNINNDYAYQATYFASTSNFMYREGDLFYVTYRPSAFDRSIQWEVTKSLNVGLDFSWFKNRLYGSVDYYNRYTSNLLMNSVMVPAGSNFAESTDQNIGEMSSKGLEFVLGGTVLSNRDFSWNLSLNFAYNSSKIERLTAYDGPPENTWVRTGGASSSRYVQYHKVGNTPNTFYLAKQVYDEDGKPLEKFYNPNYNPNVSGSQMYVTDDTANANKWDTGKSSLVPYYGGISTQMRYKSWDFGVNAHYAFGQYIYWATMDSGSNNSFFDASNQYPTNTIKGWAPEWGKQHYFSDYWLFKGDYLKIDNMVLGYTFNKVWKSKNTLRLGVGVQNVATITNYPGVDPEVYSGIDGSSTPRPRMYMISANLKF